MKIHDEPIIDANSMTWSYGWYTGDYSLNMAQETVHLSVDQIVDLDLWEESRKVVIEEIKSLHF